MNSQSKAGPFVTAIVALSVLAVDIATKAIVLRSFELHQSLAFNSFLNLGFWLNPGAAFSFLSDAGGWQRYFFSGIAIVAIVWLGTAMLFNASITPLTRIAFALIAGGAAGNLYDRLIHGAVVDWIDVHYGGWHWPAFNVADGAIVVGAGIVVLVGSMKNLAKSAK